MSELSPKVELARALARFYHGDQMYGEFPYIKHLKDVVAHVKVLVGEEEDVLCVAYLHDILEDTEIEPTMIADLFGADVLQGVSHLSKWPQSGESYESYIKKVKSNNISLKVKYCDTLANLSQSIADGNKKRIDKYSKQLELLGEKLDRVHEI